MNKKFVIISLAVVFVLVSVLAWWLFLPTRVRLNGEETATLTYKVNGKDIETTLTAEEALLVAGILNGKIAMLDIGPSCGFSTDVSIAIGGKTYCLAMDKCGSMQIAYTVKHIILTDEERTQIEEIFESYGGTFPCI